jgi:hypothetical protein
MNNQLKLLKRPALLITISLLLFSCTKKKVEIKNPAGEVVEKYFVSRKDPNLRVGSYKAYYDNGNLLEEAEYENGLPDGERKMYFEDGQLMIVEHYAKGVFEGEYLSYHADGGLAVSGQYKDNVMDGAWKKYFKTPKNRVKEEVTFSNNEEEGPFKEYHLNGKVSVEGNYSGGYMDGDIIVYDESGKVVKKLLYQNGRQIGKQEFTEGDKTPVIQ